MILIYYNRFNPIFKEVFMGTARSVLFTVLSILMIISGAAGIIAAVFILIERISFPGSYLSLSVLITGLLAAYSVINMAAGISGVRNYNRRTNSAVVIRLPEISVALCLLAIVLSCINGIMLPHLILLIITGIIIPVCFIYAAVKKSYS